MTDSTERMTGAEGPARIVASHGLPFVAYILNIIGPEAHRPHPLHYQKGIVQHQAQQGRYRGAVLVTPSINSIFFQKTQ